jgi:hypothetical protein
MDSGGLVSIEVDPFLLMFTHQDAPAEATKGQNPRFFRDFRA